MSTNAIQRGNMGRFIFFYIISVVLIGLIFYAFSQKMFSFSSGTGTVAERSAAVSEQQRILLESDGIQTKLRELHVLDKRYAEITTSGSSGGSVTAIQNTITQKEQALQKTIQEFATNRGKYRNPENIALFDKTSSYFRSALEDRKSMRIAALNMATSNLASSGGTKDSNAENVLLKGQMQVREQRIKELESQVKELEGNALTQAQKPPTVPATSAAAGSEDAALLRSYLTDAEKKNASLNEANNQLRQDNARLNTRVTELASSQVIPQLQQKVDDLNNELSFAQVDCNLSRVDNKQIISNSRQRRELMNQALKTLNNLVKSDNTSVKRRAREKMDQLNQISSTVRD